MNIHIVGQGIAGSLLAWHLHHGGHQVTISDQGHVSAASSVAAGIINPVTGKRYVKSWRYQDFFEVAKDVYQEIETLLNVKIWHEKPILRILNTIEEANDWSLRCGDPQYQAIISEAKTPENCSDLLSPAPAYGHIHQSARVDFKAILSAIRAFFTEKNLYHNEIIPFDAVSNLESKYDAIVFCGGASDLHHPYFQGIQWQLAKGEALIIELPDTNMDYTLLPMVKKGIMLVHLNDRLFWAGSNYDWSFDDAQPTKKGREWIIENLNAMLQVPYKIIDHVAAIRPTVKDRRPLIGASLHSRKVFIFNGLGTKGALLAPAMAIQLSNHILYGSPLEEDVDVQRFLIEA